MSDRIKEKRLFTETHVDGVTGARPWVFFVFVLFPLVVVSIGYVGYSTKEDRCISLHTTKENIETHYITTDWYGSCVMGERGTSNIVKIK